MQYEIFRCVFSSFIIADDQQFVLSVSETDETGNF